MNMVCVLFLLFMLTISVSADSCIQLLDGWKHVGIEERAKRSPIVLQGLAIEAVPDDNSGVYYSVKFWLINVYKGSEYIATLLNLDPGSGGVFNLRDRRINVTGFGDKSKCHSTVSPQKYYIIFAELRGNQLFAKFDDLFGAAAEWSEKNEERVWHGVGWDNWSDWEPCSTSCGEGTQERIRRCRRESGSCHGYNKERRRCNMFSCQGAVDPMKLDDRRFFHPSRGQWERVPGRPSAWRLRPNSYIWVPSSQIFPDTVNRRTGTFPREFTLLVTLKLNPSLPVQGTLFSLRSRRQQDAYLSLELEAEDRVKIVHAGRNGTQVVEIPMKINDGHWHHVGVALQDDNSVRSFLDCAWVSTDILKRNELDHPEDADLVIGYLFQGELEQLVIIPNPAAVAQQCSTSRIPLYDPAIDRNYITTTEAATRQNIKNIKDEEIIEGEEGVTWKLNRNEANSVKFTKPTNKPKIIEKVRVNKLMPLLASEKISRVDEEEVVEEGSGGGNSEYEVEWSDWSECSTSCGPGTQSRYSRCIDDGSRLELCMEAGGERTETRACKNILCQHDVNIQNKSQTNTILSNLPSDIYFTVPKTIDNSTNKEILLDADIYYPTHHTVVAKKHHKSHKHYNDIGYNSSWYQANRRMSDFKGSKKECKCLNGGVCRLKHKTCKCPNGYSGRQCEKVECDKECLNGGQCLVPNICTCPSMYIGEHCETPLCNPPCKNGGTCIQPEICSCPSGFIQPRCSPVCPGGCTNGGQCIAPGLCSCPAGYKGPLCQEPVCHMDCQNGGHCIGPEICNCPTGWTGEDCSTPVCDPPCRYGGICVKPATCQCPSQTSGTRCQNYSCRSACLNGGACVGPDQCECPHNATGSNCQEPVCEPSCENGATCMPGNRCLCDPGSGGIRCEKRKCEYRPVQEPYIRGFRRLVSKRVEKPCVPPDPWKTCVTTMPEYQTVYKTFYRTMYKCTDFGNSTIRH